MRRVPAFDKGASRGRECHTYELVLLMCIGVHIPARPDRQAGSRPPGTEVESAKVVYKPEVTNSR